ARLFGQFKYDFSASPLYASPRLVTIFTYLVPAVALGLSLWLAYQMRDFDRAYSLVIVTSVLISPVTWLHYFILATIPLCVVLQKGQLTRGSCAVLTLSFMAFCADIAELNKLIRILTSGAWCAGLITFVPTFALLALGWLLWCTGREAE